jgi:hypothetical protein
MLTTPRALGDAIEGEERVLELICGPEESEQKSLAKVKGING